MSKLCNAKFLQICSDAETHSLTSWMAGVNFLQVFIILVNYFFKDKLIDLKMKLTLISCANMSLYSCDG